MMTSDALDPTDWLARLAPPDPALWRYSCSRCGEPMMRDVRLCGPCEASDREREAAVRRRLETIPLRYRGASYSRPETLCQRVADGRAIDVTRTALTSYAVVVLLGPPGVGKSTLAAAMLGQEAEAGRSICWAPALRLAHARGEARLGAEAPEVLAAIRSRVTVIDDAGQESVTALSAIVDVVHARHDAELPLIVTSGLTRRDLGARYGGGTGRRLLEGALVVEMTGRRAS